VTFKVIQLLLAVSDAISCTVVEQ